MDTVVIAHTVSNIISCLPDESLVRRVWVHGCVPPGGGQLHQDIRPPHSGEQGTLTRPATRVPWPHITRVQISGASAGAGVAVALVLGVPLGDMASDTLAGETSRRLVDSSNTDNSMQGFRLPGTATLDHSLPHSTSRTGSEKTWIRGCLRTPTK